MGSIPGLTIAGSIIRPRYEEDALVEPAQALHLSQLWTVSCAYQHHTVTGAQQSSGLHEVFLYSLRVHLVQGGKVIGLRRDVWACETPVLRAPGLGCALHQF